MAKETLTSKTEKAVLQDISGTNYLTCQHAISSFEQISSALYDKKSDIYNRTYYFIDTTKYPTIKNYNTEKKMLVDQTVDYGQQRVEVIKELDSERKEVELSVPMAMQFGKVRVRYFPWSLKAVKSISEYGSFHYNNAVAEGDYGIVNDEDIKNLTWNIEKSKYKRSKKCKDDAEEIKPTIGVDGAYVSCAPNAQWREATYQYVDGIYILDDARYNACTVKFKNYIPTIKPENQINFDNLDDFYAFQTNEMSRYYSCLDISAACMWNVPYELILHYDDTEINVSNDIEKWNRFASYLQIKGDDIYNNESFQYKNIIDGKGNSQSNRFTTFLSDNSYINYGLLNAYPITSEEGQPVSIPSWATTYVDKAYIERTIKGKDETYQLTSLPYKICQYQSKHSYATEFNLKIGSDFKTNTKWHYFIGYADAKLKVQLNPGDFSKYKNIGSLNFNFGYDDTGTPFDANQSTPVDVKHNIPEDYLKSKNLYTYTLNLAYNDKYPKPTVKQYYDNSLVGEQYIGDLMPTEPGSKKYDGVIHFSKDGPISHYITTVEQGDDVGTTTFVENSTLTLIKVTFQSSPEWEKDNCANGLEFDYKITTNNGDITTDVKDKLPTAIKSGQYWFDKDSSGTQYDYFQKYSTQKIVLPDTLIWNGGGINDLKREDLYDEHKHIDHNKLIMYYNLKYLDKEAYWDYDMYKTEPNYTHQLYNDIHANTDITETYNIKIDLNSKPLPDCIRDFNNKVKVTINKLDDEYRSQEDALIQKFKKDVLHINCSMSDSKLELVAGLILFDNRSEETYDWLHAIDDQTNLTYDIYVNRYTEQSTFIITGVECTTKDGNTIKLDKYDQSLSTIDTFFKSNIDGSVFANISEIEVKVDYIGPCNIYVKAEL